jgi:hypothetical protein
MPITIALRIGSNHRFAAADASGQIRHRYAKADTERDAAADLDTACSPRAGDVCIAADDASDRQHQHEQH